MAKYEWLRFVRDFGYKTGFLKPTDLGFIPVDPEPVVKVEAVPTPRVVSAFEVQGTPFFELVSDNPLEQQQLADMYRVINDFLGVEAQVPKRDPDYGYEIAHFVKSTVTGLTKEEVYQHDRTSCEAQTQSGIVPSMAQLSIVKFPYSPTKKKVLFRSLEIFPASQRNTSGVGMVLPDGKLYLHTGYPISHDIDQVYQQTHSAFSLVANAIQQGRITRSPR